MANHMAEVAKLLGVELGESFKITSDTQGDYPGDYQNYYRFTENNCFELSDDGVEWKMTTAAVLLKHILMGDIRIIKLPWKPQIREKYYVPRIATRPEDRYYWYHWQNSDADIKRYDMGIVCKTKEEAIDMSKKMLAITKERGEIIMADYYKNVANMLGVELGEIFKINDTRNEYAAYYRFTTEGIEQAGDINDKEIYWSLSDSCILNDLICGKTAKITKLPQKPKNGDMYYVPAFEVEGLYTEYLWNNDNTDKVCYERNVVFKTPEKAAKVAKEMLAMLKESEN